MITYSHSGSLGDLIYSLPVVKRLGDGDFYVKLRAVDQTSRNYGYRVEHISDFHKLRLTDTDYEMLRPLLKAQPYISDVHSCDIDFQPNVDLDKFRGVMWRTFVGNYIEAYFKTFGIQYSQSDLVQPWLTVPTPRTVAGIIVCRTFRYRGKNADAVWSSYTQVSGFSDSAVFIGLPEEHQDFCDTFKIDIPYYKCIDFLDMASIIAGSLMFIGNQTFAYSIAQGLGKSTALETISDRTLANNECYFNRDGCIYF